MSRASLHVLAAAAVVGASATLASALDVTITLTPDRNSTAVAGQLTYAYRAKGTAAKGKERLRIVGGTAYLADYGTSMYVTADPGDGERAPFLLSFFAPIGRGRTTNTTLACSYRSRSDTGEERAYNLADAATTADTLDRFVAGTLGGFGTKGKRPSVAMAGALDVGDLKAKAKLRRRGTSWTGSVTQQIRGTILDGENAGHPFKAKLKVKIRESRESDGGIVLIDGFVTNEK